MARNLSSKKRKEIKDRKRHLATTASGQRVAVTDTGMILGLQNTAAAAVAVAEGWPKNSHTKVVMEFCEIWGSEGLAAVLAPPRRFA
jgi:hypothetical protein